MSLRPPPTHAELTAFFQKLLPGAVGAREVPFHYHTPRHPSYNPVRQQPARVVLSITPTSGFYEACSDPIVRGTVCFLHRPWNLDRKAVRPGTFVLASHAAFDESLTVGWNVALAEQLQVDLPNAICLSGYKDNPDRKIGLVGQLHRPVLLSKLVESIKQQYDGAGELHGLTSDGEAADREVTILAIMNAFHEDEILRVTKAAHEKGWIDRVDDGREILYLTGAAREYGLEAIAKYNMAAYCVGHRACEEWGIRYLAEQLRLKWPKLDVIEVLEEEEILERSSKKQKPGEDKEVKTSINDQIPVMGLGMMEHIVVFK